MVSILVSFWGKRPIFRCELLVSFRDGLTAVFSPAKMLAMEDEAHLLLGRLTVFLEVRSYLEDHPSGFTG